MFVNKIIFILYFLLLPILANANNILEFNLGGIKLHMHANDVQKKLNCKSIKQHGHSGLISSYSLECNEYYIQFDRHKKAYFVQRIKIFSDAPYKDVVEKSLFEKYGKPNVQVKNKHYNRISYCYGNTCEVRKKYTDITTNHKGKSLTIMLSINDDGNSEKFRNMIQLNLEDEDLKNKNQEIFEELYNQKRRKDSKLDL